MHIFTNSSVSLVFLSACMCEAVSLTRTMYQGCLVPRCYYTCNARLYVGGCFFQDFPRALLFSTQRSVVRAYIRHAHKLAVRERPGVFDGPRLVLRSSLDLRDSSTHDMAHRPPHDHDHGRHLIAGLSVRNFCFHPAGECKFGLLHK